GPQGEARRRAVGRRGAGGRDVGKTPAAEGARGRDPLRGERGPEDDPEMSGIRIRPATLRDLDVLVRQRRRMFEEMRPYSEEEHAVGDREYRRWAKRLMANGDFVAWIAETGA